jgi:RHS repeat-associated protein
MAISTGPGVQPYKYTGKELDMQHGLNLYDFSARTYDPAIGRFTTMDPLAEKYYSISPYAYCLNNPVRNIDPDGREVWIYYEDEEGKRQQMLYTANMKYEGNNSFVSASVNYLNAVYTNGSAEVMDVLIGSSNRFNMLNQTPTDKNGNVLDALQFNEAEGGGGNIYAGMLMNSQYSDYSKVEGVSHELFHGFQYEKGQGGASIFNEVEAMVYSSVVSSNWAYSTDYIGALSSNGLGNGTASGNIYQQSFNSLVSSGFSKNVFHDAVKAFKTGSNSNASGGYNNYPLVRTPKSYLLKQYHPNRPIK